MDWPKISIVTPSFNQARYLERTLASVLDQNYPALEYIVIDGGSTDGSVEILRRYAPRLAFWVSEADRGQAHALNKGFARATGEIIGWLNADDLYCPGALHHVGSWFAAHPADEAHYGGLLFIDEDDVVTDAHWACAPDPDYVFYVGLDVHQQALFWRRSVMESIGWLDEEMHFSMDTDFILRLLLAGKMSHTPRYLGMFREHAEAKSATMLERSFADHQVIEQRYGASFPRAVPRIWRKHPRLYLQGRRLVRLARGASPGYWFFKLARRTGWRVSPLWHMRGADKIEEKRIGQD